MFNNLAISFPDEVLSPDISDELRDLSSFLSLELIEKPAKNGYRFEIKEDGLGLYSYETKQAKTKKVSLLHIDFVNGKNAHRHKNNCTVNQAIAKAVGIKPGFRPTIFDATAGLGGDSFVLACLGCEIELCERSKFLYVLLKDAIKRGKNHHGLNDIIAKMTLISGNSLNILGKNKKEFHTIYMDPMYPHKSKSALNKIEMRVIRELVGDDNDSDDIFKLALAVAKNRVVVKRPKGAPFLADKTPTHQITMKNSRFDVYLTNSIS